MVRTVPSALTNLKDEHLKLREPSGGGNCDVETNLLIQNGFMGKSLSNGEYQGSLMKMNVEDVVPSVMDKTRLQQPLPFQITSEKKKFFFPQET